MREEVNRPMEYHSMKVRALPLFVLSRSIGEAILKAKNKRTLWNPMFNYVVDNLVRRHGDDGAGGMVSRSVVSS